MVEVGTLEIVGTINTAQIDAGLSRMRISLQRVSDSTKPVQADFDRISGTLGKMSLGFIGLAAVGVGLFNSLAKSAPALAGAFARAEVATDKLKRSLGREFKGAADTAVGAFERLVEIVKTLEGTGIVSGGIIGAGIGSVIGGVGGFGIGGPVGAAGGALAGAVLGGIFGAGQAALPGGVAGAATGGIFDKGVVPRLFEGFFSRESDRKFNLFNIIDSVFG